MLRYLVIADAHANLPALEAVFEHANGKYDKVIYLGDHVGYGPFPEETTQMIKQKADFVIQGNHDLAAVDLSMIEWFNPYAKAMIFYTRLPGVLSADSLGFLESLEEKTALNDKKFLLTHGCPHNNYDYILRWIDAVTQIEHIEDKNATPIVFFAHSHNKSIFYERGGVPYIPSQSSYHLQTDKVIFVNPGSIGQPRDDPINGIDMPMNYAFASYGILNVNDDGKMEFQFHEATYSLDPLIEKYLEIHPAIVNAIHDNIDEFDKDERKKVSRNGKVVTKLVNRLMRQGSITLALQ
ncbi:MAG: metallophosphoesterase family protein [Candidatus Woesearchaeota archaeon]